MKKLKLPIIILLIGIIATVGSCLLTCIAKEPTITEYEFDYSITYKVDDVTTTINGRYKCVYSGLAGDSDPLSRCYKEEYNTLPSRYIIAEKDGLQLYIVIDFNHSYLMGDTEDDYYEPFLDDPCLEAMDVEGNQYDDEQTLSRFNAEIVSWEYPDPLENTFVFSGFSIMHTASMLVMVAVITLTLIFMMITVRKDRSTSYNVLDVLSIVLNFVVSLGIVPFITVVVAFLPLTMSCDTFLYQAMLCTPAFILLTVAASVAFRRKGFRKLGFFAQLIGPALFFGYVFVEGIIHGFA